ncbi:hypothetical protein [Nodularia spumigena]|uniref:Uncharacterized protein n=2 Tax=Nodularia spumigena TaxID=70799 RepID=A0ABU5UKF4_NODSP|nr:hypothetical protein [Nodularia spumigena]MEA5524822.1 hypothetical protein [Nodularia spumigena UHCC 0143]MEA5606756.1 hypothetical protein [Nodularia spumigena UHCC 0060]
MDFACVVANYIRLKLFCGCAIAYRLKLIYSRYSQCHEDEKMDVEKLSNPTTEVSDITAWDKNGQKLLVSKIRARDIEEDIQSKVEEMLKFEYEHNHLIVPYGMTATPENINIFQWEGKNLESVYTFPTHEVMTEYDSEFSKKRIFEYYRETLVEGWLRDLAYNWKTDHPPKSEELKEIGFVVKLADVRQ